MVMVLNLFNPNRLLSDKRRYAAVITGATCVRHRVLIVDTESSYNCTRRCELDGGPPMPLGIIHLKKTIPKTPDANIQTTKSAILKKREANIIDSP